MINCSRILTKQKKKSIFDLEGLNLKNDTKIKDKLAIEDEQEKIKLKIERGFDMYNKE